MNVGYIKIDKLGKISRLYRNIFKIIRIEGENYYIPSSKEKVLEKLAEKLKANNVEYIIKEKGIEFKYNQFEGKYIMKYMLPEILEYCFNMLEKEIRMSEIYITVEKFTKENIDIIEELSQKVKVVNVITNHIKQFQELEKRLERSGIYITVSSNKRKALKRAEIVVNMDFRDYKGFNVNRNSIIINVADKLEIGKEFDGIIIEKAFADTNKVMRIFSEMPNMNKQELIESLLAKRENYLEAREVVKISKLVILKLQGRRNIIGANEFYNLKRRLTTNAVIKN